MAPSSCTRVTSNGRQCDVSLQVDALPEAVSALQPPDRRPSEREPVDLTGS